MYTHSLTHSVLFTVDIMEIAPVGSFSHVSYSAIEVTLKKMAKQCRECVAWVGGKGSSFGERKKSLCSMNDACMTL